MLRTTQLILGQKRPLRLIISCFIVRLPKLNDLLSVIYFVADTLYGTFDPFSATPCLYSQTFKFANRALRSERGTSLDPALNGVKLYLG